MNELSKHKTQKTGKPYWVEIIEDFTNGLDFNYSDIARQIDVVPSTIQKLARNWQRQPLPETFYKLITVHYQLFFSKSRLPQGDLYIKWKGQGALIQRQLNNSLVQGNKEIQA